MQSPDEVDQPLPETEQVLSEIQPTTNQATVPLEMPPATVQASSHLTNTPLVHNMSSRVAGTIHQTPPIDASPSGPTWTPNYPSLQSSRMEHSPLPHPSWPPPPPYYPPPYPYPWYGQAYPPPQVSMTFPPPITTTVPVSSMPPVVPIPQLSVPSMVLPQANDHLPQSQACPPTIPVAPVVPVQDTRYDELKAAMDAQVTLIATLIASKGKESVEEVKRLCPLADEVYSESLPEKYKRPTFTKFDGEGNPVDHITVFEIECRSISANGKLKLQQFPALLSENALRWFSNCPAGSIKT